MEWLVISDHARRYTKWGLLWAIINEEYEHSRNSKRSPCRQATGCAHNDYVRAIAHNL
jgi:hypothetical protein